MKRVFFIRLLGLFLVSLVIIGCSVKQIEQKYESVNYENGKFKNQYLDYDAFNFDKIMKISKAYYNNDVKDSAPAEDFNIPVVKITADDILNIKDNSVIRFGHSTLLFKIDDRIVITDPMFGQRASPFSFMGPKRFHENPIEAEDMPFIDVIVISHNHYDHMDEYSLNALKDNFGAMYVPLGIKEKMVEIGLDASKIIELDWWQSVQNGSLSFTATPSQHFSGRGLFDGDETLWASWVINSSKSSIFFSGDSGYFRGFKDIGDKFGPFDMTFMENGAYNENWAEIHMMPEQAVQAHIDLKGKIMFPIHNGTFDLALHSWTEPFERVLLEAQKRGVKVVHPKMGEVIPLKEYSSTAKWWEGISNHRYVKK